MKNIHHLFKSMHIACLPLMHPSDITIAIIILQSKKTKYSKFEIVQVKIQINPNQSKSKQRCSGLNTGFFGSTSRVAADFVSLMWHCSPAKV